MAAQARNVANATIASIAASPQLLFVSVWVYALASGLLAYGVAEIIAAITQPNGLRLTLQMATIPAVAVPAGLVAGRGLAALGRIGPGGSG